jgi:hypothetical protein
MNRLWFINESFIKSRKERKTASGVECLWLKQIQVGKGKLISPTKDGLIGFCFFALFAYEEKGGKAIWIISPVEEYQRFGELIFSRQL